MRAVTARTEEMSKIYILHENDAWLPPLRAALEERALPYEEWHLAKGAIDLASEPPRGVFYNRMSASAHTRGHDHAPELAAAVLAWLETHDRRVINGSRALDLEISKARQYAALSAFDIRTPPTRVALGREAILAAARELGPPVIVKPNRGGKGLGVRLFHDLAALEEALDGGCLDPGPGGVMLVQQYIRSADASILRNEYVGGRFLYAVRVDTSQGFELCPADACTVGDAFCPTGEAAPRPMFEILEGFAHEDLARYERFLAANGIEIAGIEMIVDENGRTWTYDVNTNTNYNPEAEAAAGIAGTDRAGMGAIARHLDEELARLAPPALDAAE